MDTLILAAGCGSRLSTVSPVKPLTAIAGIPLLELAVMQAASAGVERAVVVTGHRAEQIEAALPAIAERSGIAVIACRVHDHMLTNGHSVLAGAQLVEGPYLLQMSDHVFSGSILRRLVEQGAEGLGVRLAIDRRWDGEGIDPLDATWVETDDTGTICAIGKDLERYNAVDCGAFLATGELARAIEQAIAAGRPGSLSDGMQLLAQEGRAGTMDIADAWWLDVDDPHFLALAERRAPLHLPEIYGAWQARSGGSACSIRA